MDEPPNREQFGHLTGARSLAAFWIVCAHYLPKRDESFNAVFRVNVAVCFFVVASGFVTHWAYGSKVFNTWSDILRFYMRRLGKVVVTFWIALLWAAYLLHREGVEVELSYLFRCAIFLEQWFKWCPNGPSWFVFVLLPSWILYPFTRKVLVLAEEKHGGSGLCVVLAGLWIISFGPAVVLLLLQGNITMQQHADMSFWPPAQLADFAIGMAAAAIVRRSRGADAACGTLRPSVLADSSLLVILLVVFAVPRPRTTYVLHLNGWEPLLDHGLALPIAGFLLGSCMQGTEGLSARLLRHSALVSLGEVSFEVYIFQRPMHDTLTLFLPTDQMEAGRAWPACSRLLREV
ncbi:CARNS1 [Symbiodinium pilosum]|uniref:CARNS1 protein n=1 Tax=Symbiodinium pilosum TaxID=2952 RepID=A0A812N9S0_SYMPI|nr:CARNS1 [Symbiodinium pilosum]